MAAASSSSSSSSHNLHTPRAALAFSIIATLVGAGLLIYTIVLYGRVIGANAPIYWSFDDASRTIDFFVPVVVCSGTPVAGAAWTIGDCSIPVGSAPPPTQFSGTIAIGSNVRLTGNATANDLRIFTRANATSSATWQLGMRIVNGAGTQLGGDADAAFAAGLPSPGSLMLGAMPSPLDAVPRLLTPAASTAQPLETFAGGAVIELRDSANALRGVVALARNILTGDAGPLVGATLTGATNATQSLATGRLFVTPRGTAVGDIAATGTPALPVLAVAGDVMCGTTSPAP